jgi:hypothetical protein
MLEHYDEYDGPHCENYCNKFTCIYKSLIRHSLGDCVRCVERAPLLHIRPTLHHRLADLRQDLRQQRHARGCPQRSVWAWRR